MKNVTLRQLKVFEAVARHLSFSRAAEELHLTQPAVSMQVKSLEDEAGLPLTEQVGKKVFLTTAGTELARHARVIAQQLREAGQALAAIKGVRGGMIHIGVVSTAKYFAPRLMTLFRGRHPDVELRLGVHNRETVIKLLANNEIDMAIMGLPPRELDTASEVFAEHPLVIIAPLDHPLACRDSISPDELSDETFLIREQGSGTRGAMERFFAERGVTLAKTLEIGSNETIKQAVMAGMGLSFISSHSIALELAVERLICLRVEGTPVMRQWHVVRRAEKHFLPPAAAFHDFLCQEGSRLIAEGICQTPIPPKKA